MFTVTLCLYAAFEFIYALFRLHMSIWFKYIYILHYHPVTENVSCFVYSNYDFLLPDGVYQTNSGFLGSLTSS